MIHGPLCHYWLQWTEDNLSFDGAWFGTPVKVLADQTVWSIFLNTAYTTCIMALQGMGPAKIKGEVEATWYNAISAGRVGTFHSRVILQSKHPLMTAGNQSNSRSPV
jgi:protein Mpv17